MDLPFETLSEIIDCDPSSGLLIWRPRGANMFSGRLYNPERLAASWNAKNAGKPAINSLNDRGYLVGSIRPHRMFAHRVVWTFANGRPPHGWLDHINGVRSDNRSSNLREVTPTENAQNSGISKNNVSGVTGVHWRERDQVWVATIGVGYRKVWLGQFRRFDDAVLARRDAERSYGLFGGSRLSHVGGLFR